MPDNLIYRLLNMSFTLHNKRLLRWLILNVRLYALICVAGYFLFANKLSAQQENEIEPSPDDVVIDLVHVDIRKHEALYQVPLNLARVINNAEVFIYNEDNDQHSVTKATIKVVKQHDKMKIANFGIKSFVSNDAISELLKNK